MSAWHSSPTVYEINTWVWLFDLERKYGRKLSLATVPASEWNAIAQYGFDAVWLMGVWQRSPASAAVADHNAPLLESFRRALPDFQPEDNVGSPYSVRRYQVDESLGGPAGLAQARRELAARGMRMILDFVPNHVAPDHPWVSSHPEFFIRGSAEDLKSSPESYFEASGTIYACGRDPCFPAWPDVLQLNAFHSGLRRAAIGALSEIANQSDGVRCDMAMLPLHSVFQRTWGVRAGDPPPVDYWKEVIPAVRALHPGFLFVAEAYWDLEWELQQQGFDFCYDKRLYDRLEKGTAESVRLHLGAGLEFQSKLLRFLENHDEPRAASAFSPLRERAAAVVAATLPGARLFHEGQIEGRKVRLPVFLRRRPPETTDESLASFYSDLLKAIRHPALRNGRWSLCKCSGWEDNSSSNNVLAWSWQKDRQFSLVVVNLSDFPSQARVSLDWPELVQATWRFSDVLSGDRYERLGDELAGPGLYVDLAPWRYHFFACEKRDSMETVRGQARSAVD